MKNIALLAAIAMATLPSFAAADDDIKNGLNAIIDQNNNYSNPNDNGASVSTSNEVKDDPNCCWEFGPKK